jgi:hypothetical protein
MTVDGRHRPTAGASPYSGRVAVVLKWLIAVDDRTTQFALPADAEVVAVRAHDTDPAKVWFWTLHTQPAESHIGPRVRYRNLRVYGTGQPIPVPCAHLGTAFAGGLVWHLIELL